MIKEQSVFFPSIKQAIYLLLLYILLYIVISAIAMALLNVDVYNSLLSLCRTLSAASLTLLVAYSMKRKYNEKIAFFFRKSNIEIYIEVIIIPFLSIFFLFGLFFFISTLFGISDAPPFSRSADVYTFISVVCVTPIFEELLFRGIILDSFLKQYSFLKAMILSVFLFAILHFSFQILTAIYIGILASYIYFYTKSMWLCILLHGTNNLYAFIGIYLTHNISIDTSTNHTEDSFLFSFVVMWLIDVILLSFILYRFFYLLKSKNNCNILWKH